MNKQKLKLFCICVILLCLMPVRSLAALPPSAHFVLYKAGQPLADNSLAIVSCNRIDVDSKGNKVAVHYCNYSGLEPGLVTIYQVKNNESDKYTFSSDKDISIKLDKYVEGLVKTSTKSITVNVKQSDNKTVAAYGNIYYSVDIDTGKIAYVGNSAPKIIDTNINDVTYHEKGIQGFEIFKIYWLYIFVASLVGALIITFVGMVLIKIFKSRKLKKVQTAPIVLDVNYQQPNYSVTVATSEPQSINPVPSSKIKLKIPKYLAFYLFSLIIFFVVISTVVVTFYKQDGVSMTVSPRNIPKISTSQISTWLTYDNSKYNFTFKYPKVWSIQKNDDTESDSGPTLVIDTKSMLNGLFYIEINNKYNELACINKYCYTYSASAQNNKVALTNEQFNEQSGQMMIADGPSSSPPGYEFSTNRFVYKGVQYQIGLDNYRSSSKQDADNAKAFFEQIVSTINFR